MFSGFISFITIVSSVLCLTVVASTQEIPSAMCVVNSLQKEQKSSAWKALSVLKKPIMHTLACKLVTKINVGHHTSYVNTAVVL